MYFVRCGRPLVFSPGILRTVILFLYSCVVVNSYHRSVYVPRLFSRFSLHLDCIPPYRGYKARAAAKGEATVTVASFDYMCFHSPYHKLVKFSGCTFEPLPMCLVVLFYFCSPAFLKLICIIFAIVVPSKNFTGHFVDLFFFFCFYLSLQVQKGFSRLAYVDALDVQQQLPTPAAAADGAPAVAVAIPEELLALDYEKSLEDKKLDAVLRQASSSAFAEKMSHSSYASKEVSG